MDAHLFLSRAIEKRVSSMHARLVCAARDRGDEWSLRVFASMQALRFFASTSRDKKFALRAASSLESTTCEQRALLIFFACSNPYVNPFSLK